MIKLFKQWLLVHLRFVLALVQAIVQIVGTMVIVTSYTGIGMWFDLNRVKPFGWLFFFNLWLYRKGKVDRLVVLDKVI